MNERLTVVYVTANEVTVYVEPGRKSPLDFIVSHDTDDGRTHRVYHRDFIRDIYLKRNTHPEATLELINYFVDIIENTKGTRRYPPILEQFDADQVERFQDLGLGSAGGYGLELLFVLFELVQSQEETNYKGGWVPRELYTTVRDDTMNLERISYLTEVVVRSRENRRTLTARDSLLQDLREIAGK